MDEIRDRQVDLDLDALEPESRTIKVSGQILEVRPPKMVTLTKLLKLARKFDEVDESNEDEVVAAVEEIRTALEPMIPGIKNPGIDFSLTQLMGLFRFIQDMAKPPETKVLEENDLTPTMDKKGGQNSSEQPPTS